MENICITGIWHQGMVVSACLADMGHQVRGVCAVEDARQLNNGEPLVHEPYVAEILSANLRAGRLHYTTSFAEGLAGASFVYISTDTPVDDNDHSDLAPIFALASSIAQHLQADIILVVTAQVPVGTSQALAERIRQEAPQHRVGVAYVPEFLRLGTAVDTFRQADRFVIGCDDPVVAERVAEIYHPLDRPLVFTGIRSAEMAKHAANAFLAMSISFANEIANLCEPLGADVRQVERILKLDKRIGPYAFLSAGLGFAGGTLGREVRALQDFGSQYKTPTPLMDAVWQVNQTRAGMVVQRLEVLLGGLAGKQVGILGLTYKAGTSTLRRSLALVIIRLLIAQGAQVRAFDPLADLDVEPELPDITICMDPYVLAEGCQAVVLVTEWAEINQLDFARLRQAMTGDLFLDTRNLLDQARLSQAGLRAYGIGR